MTPFTRPLEGCVVGLSISESDDSTNRGFPSWQVNRITLQVVAALFGQGSGVIFGHDWREDGVMEAIHGFARQMQSPDSISPGEAKAAGQPLLQNLLPWPDTPQLAREDLDRLASTLRVEEAGLPQELRAYDAQHFRISRDSLRYAYLRARGLTHLRHRLNELCHARVCIGGRRGGSAGRYPGIIEEALLAVQSEKPLYLVGLLGGATRQIVDAIEGRPMPENFGAAGKGSTLFATPPAPIKEKDPATRADRVVDAGLVWGVFRQLDIKTLSRLNGLQPEENAELFHTTVLDRAIQLILKGLFRFNL